jgi:protein-S-isoprenylcysteine O-methyltransferase Ste14
MQTLGWVTYLLFLAYVANFLMLSVVAAKQANRSIWLFNSGERAQRLTGWAFRIGFTAAVMWPPIRMWAGGLPGDPVPGFLQGAVSAVLGHLLVAVGAVVALVSQYHMGSAWRIGAAEGEQEALVQTGPFAISRNPVFVGQAILFTGLFLAFSDIAQFIISAAVLASMLAQARIEERVLKASFGKEYEDYAARVPRWLRRPRSPS